MSYKNLALLAILFGVFAVSTATHFRYGSISWSISSSQGYNVVDFKLQLGYRLSFEDFDRVEVGKCVAQYSWWYGDYYCNAADNVGRVSFGDGSTDVYPTCMVNSVYQDDDWFTCTMSVSHTYPTGSGTYTASLVGSARFQDLINNANKDYKFSTTVVINPSVSSNASPVTGSLPIIILQQGVPNSFQIVATSQAGNTLTYRLSTGSEMGGSSLTQPPGLTVSTTGLVSFNPPQLGFYTCQVIISDGTNIIANDFMIQVVPYTDSAPFFVAPTPDVTDIIRCTVGATCKWDYVASSKSAKVKKVQIYASNVPAFVKSPAINTPALPHIVNNTWTPFINQTGSYVVSLGVTDDQGVSAPGQRSFTILVQSSQCGNGHQSTPGCDPATVGCCVCDGGWTGNTCQNCDYETHHGPDCVPNDPCYNGTIHNGPTGDGICDCYLGYTGQYCNQSLIQACKSSDQSGVTYSRNSQGFVNPTDMSVYMTSTPFTLPIQVNVPSSIPNIDAYFLVDTNLATSQLQTDYKSYFKTLLNGFTSAYETPRFGLGFYSDGKSGFNFQHDLLLGSYVETDINSYPFTISAAANKNSMDALLQAVKFPSGFRVGAFRAIVIFTDTDAAASSNQDLLDALRTNFIQPVVVGLGGVTLTNWNAFVNAAGFGAVISSTSNSNDYVTKTLSAYKTATTKIAPAIVKGSNTLGFVQSVPAPSVVGTNRSVSVGVGLAMPAQVPAALGDSIIVSVPGFGMSTASIKFNHAPVAYGLSIAVKQGGSTNFTLAGSDIDQNQLTASFTQLPTKGVLSITDNGASVSTSSSFSLAQLFFYKPTTAVEGDTDSFTYQLNDGCTNSNPATYTISVIKGDGIPPVAIFTNVTTDENVPKNFTFNFSDKDMATVTIKLGNLPTNGKLYFLNGTQVTSIAVRVPVSLTYVPNKDFSDENTAAGVGPSDTIYFSAFNKDNLQSLSQATAVFYINPRNPPIYTGLFGFTTRENTPLTFPLSGIIPSDSKYIEMRISSVVGQGELKHWKCSEPGCMATVTAPYIATTTDGKWQFTYIPPTDIFGDYLLKFYFDLVSSNGVAAEQVMVYVNVTHVKKPPTVQFVDFLELSINEDIPKPLPVDKFVPIANNTVNSWVDRFVIVRFKAFSRDADNTTLVGVFDNKVGRGTPIVYDTTQGDSMGDAIKNGQELGYPQDGYYYFVYAWQKKTSGLNYARITVRAVDENGLTSSSETATLNVLRTYEPPVIHVGQYNWTILAKQNLVVTNVSFESVEAVAANKNVTLRLSVVDEKRQNVSTSSVSLFGNTDGYCRHANNTRAVLVCTGSVATLNNFLSQVNMYHNKSGNHVLNVYVENTFLVGVMFLPAANISDTEDLTIGVTAASTTGGNNKTVLSAAIAAAVVAAAIIALGVWRLLRARAPPTDAFFGDSPFTDGAVSSNPLYVQSQNSQVNPLYENQA